MEIRERLGWDSSFFGFEVEKITLAEDFSPSFLTAQLQDSPAEAMYIFTPWKLSRMQCDALAVAGAVEYDVKTVYGKDILGSSPLPAINFAESPSEEMYDLAVAAGWCSRFKLDPGFRPEFERLYRRWLDKAFEDSSSAVITVKEDNQLAGLVTVARQESHGSIGLLAVRESLRGRGIGCRLMVSCDAYYRSHGVTSATVVTQEKNIPACRLYEKNGYHLIDRTRVWHWWKRSLNK